MDKTKIEKSLSFIEQEIEDLKSRWPAHSLKPAMLHRLEELEEERDRLLSLNEKD